MDNKVDAELGRQMERRILRAIAYYGPIQLEPPNNAYIEAIVDLFNKEFRRKYLADESFARTDELHIARCLVMGLVNDGLLSTQTSQSGPASGLTIKGWARLDELDHSWRAWWERHGWSAVIAGSAALTSLTATVTLIIRGIS